MMISKFPVAHTSRGLMRKSAFLLAAGLLPTCTSCRRFTATFGREV